MFSILFLVLLVLVVVSFKPKKFWVASINDEGVFTLNDGRKILLSDVKISQRGEDKHDEAIFLLNEMTKSVEVWLKKEANGYRMWIGCTDKFFTYDCSKGVLINDALVKAGLATKNP